MFINLLIIEDNYADIVLIERELKKEKLEFKSRVIDAKEDLIPAVNEFKPDIILSDYALPQWNAIDALNILKENEIEIPLILVTGSQSEEVAVKCMKAGAADYILKSSLKRLPSSILNVVEQLKTEKEKKEALKKLKKSEKRYRLIFDNSLAGILTVEKEGIIKDCNNAFAGMLGFKDKNDIIDKDIIQFYKSPSDREKMLTELINNNGILLNYEIEFVKKNGDPVWILNNIKLVDEGKQKFLNGSILDITERKNSEKILRASERKFRELADLLPETIFEIDRNGIITFTNKAGFEKFNYQQDEIKKQITILDLIDESDHWKLNENFKNTLKGTKRDASEYTAVTKDGKKFPVNVYVSPILRNSKAEGLRGILIDITDKKKAFDQILKAKEEAEEANRLKSTFISNMSHEIRTPLNAMLGLNEILKEEFAEYNTNETQLLFDSIEESGKRLLNTITQILDLSRIETGEFPVEFETIDLNTSVNNSIKVVKILADKKGLSINYNYSGDVKIIADEYCLNSIIINILSNAIKYSDKGVISVSVFKEKDKGIITVKDEGIGMSEEYQKHLFKSFSQEDIGFTRKFEGTGLGLSLTKKFVNLINSNINIKSEKNKGTTVTVSFPSG